MVDGQFHSLAHPYSSNPGLRRGDELTH